MTDENANNEIIVSKDTTSLSKFSASGLLKRGVEIALLATRQSQIETAENFLLRYITATKPNTTEEEKIFYRAIDILIRGGIHNDILTKSMLANLNEGTNFYQKISAKAFHEKVFALEVLLRINFGAYEQKMFLDFLRGYLWGNQDFSYTCSSDLLSCLEKIPSIPKEFAESAIQIAKVFSKLKKKDDNKWNDFKRTIILEKFINVIRNFGTSDQVRLLLKQWGHDYPQIVFPLTQAMISLGYRDDTKGIINALVLLPADQQSSEKPGYNDQKYKGTIAENILLSSGLVGNADVASTFFVERLVEQVKQIKLKIHGKKFSELRADEIEADVWQKAVYYTGCLSVVGKNNNDTATTLLELLDVLYPNGEMAGSEFDYRIFLLEQVVSTLISFEIYEKWVLQILLNMLKTIPLSHIAKSVYQIEGNFDDFIPEIKVFVSDDSQDIIARINYAVFLSRFPSTAQFGLTSAIEIYRENYGYWDDGLSTIAELYPLDSQDYPFVKLAQVVIDSTMCDGVRVDASNAILRLSKRSAKL